MTFDRLFTVYTPLSRFIIKNGLVFCFFCAVTTSCYSKVDDSTLINASLEKCTQDRNPREITFNWCEAWSHRPVLYPHCDKCLNRRATWDAVVAIVGSICRRWMFASLTFFHLVMSLVFSFALVILQCSPWPPADKRRNTIRQIYMCVNTS